MAHQYVRQNMKHTPKIIIGAILGIITIACLLCWLCGTGAISDFGLNAFTETLGIAATVYIIDYIIARHDRRKLLPQKISAYEDVRLLTSRIISFWTEAYRLSVPDAPPKSIEELLSEESISKIRSLLHLDSEANITPKRQCWQWVDEALRDWKTRSEKILERHNHILDPQAYSSIHTLANDCMEPGLMHGLRQSDVEFGFMRPKVLGNYTFFQRSYFEATLGLMKWCQKERSDMEKEGYLDLRKVIDTVHPWTPSTNPKCMIPRELLLRQIDEFEKSRNRKSA